MVTLGIIRLSALVCTLPFALWRTNSFMRSVVVADARAIPTDSLSFPRRADRNGLGRGSFLWAIGAAIVAALVSLVTTRNTPSGFATSAALIMFAMFALGSKAFCNYYYFVIGAMCCRPRRVPGARRRTLRPADAPHARRPARGLISRAHLSRQAAGAAVRQAIVMTIAFLPVIP